MMVFGVGFGATLLALACVHGKIHPASANVRIRTNVVMVEDHPGSGTEDRQATNCP
jgi:hypothetical protein